MCSRDSIDTYISSRSWCDNDETKSIALRETVNVMYYSQHMSKNAITRQKGVSKKFVLRWTASPDQEFSQDARGWTKGMRRKWDTPVEERIRDIHANLREDPHQFFTGATAVAQEWRRRYPDTHIFGPVFYIKPISLALSAHICAAPLIFNSVTSQ